MTPHELIILTLSLCCGLVGASGVTPSHNTCNETRAAVSPDFSLWDHLPREWCEICEIDYVTDSDVNASIICHVTPRDQVQWRLADLRTALTASVADSLHLELAVAIHCRSGGSISLPFPMRAPALVKLRVLNCHLLDKFADFREAVTTPKAHRDWMREMVIDSCTWLNAPADEAFVRENLHTLREDLECGQDDTLVTYVYRNNSEHTLPGHEPWLQTSGEPLPAESLNQPPAPPASERAEGLHSDAAAPENQSFRGGWGGDGGGDGGGGPAGGEAGGGEAGGGGVQGEVGVSEEFLQGQVQLAEMQVHCRYRQLEVLEESLDPHTSNLHFQLLAQNSRFPQLRVLNYSATGLSHVPRELRHFRRSFPSSPLGIIDLSHNCIRGLGPLPLYPPSSHSPPTTLILQFNNITEISFHMFKEWARVRDFYVDIRYNPIACHCGLKDLVGHLQRNDSSWAGPAMTYYKGQLSVMTCATPPELSGKVIGSLRMEDLPCSKAVAALAPALVAVLLVTSLLLALVILMLRYRREVRILFYTRAHFLLPCLSACGPGSHHPSGGEGEEKLYDAFVAYAHQDSPWVLESLVPVLEQSSSSSGGGSVWRRHLGPCRLCLHQRDFVVGKPIIDNIVDGIAASRHTIVVLSRSFVRSGWAMEELYQAYQQSLAERRRHLVLVMLEHVPVAEMAPVLRRCCHTFTYLSVSDTLFWDRLLYSIHSNEERSNATIKPAALEVNAPTKKKDKKCKKNDPPKDNRNTAVDSQESRHAKDPRSGEEEDTCLHHGRGEDSQHKNGGNKGDNALQDGGGAGQDSLRGEDGHIEGLGVGEDWKKRAIFSEAMRSVSMESARTSGTSDSSSATGGPLTPSQLDWERPLIVEEV